MTRYRWSVVYGIVDYTIMFHSRVGVSEKDYEEAIRVLPRIEGRGDKWDFRGLSENNCHFIISGLAQKVITDVARQAKLRLPERKNFSKVDCSRD